MLGNLWYEKQKYKFFPEILYDYWYVYYTNHRCFEYKKNEIKRKKNSNFKTAESINKFYNLF